MAWTSIAAGQTDAGSIVNQTLMDAIRTNLDDLNTRVSTLASVSDADIRDDFTADALNIRNTAGGAFAPNLQEQYMWDPGGSTAPALSTNPDHYCTLSHAGAGDWCIMAASIYKMRIDLSNSHSVVYELRHKSGQSDNTEVWTFGFQDASLATTAATSVTTQTEFIGFIQGTANTYTAVTKTGGSTTTVASNQGNAANWTVLKIAVTPASVEFFIDGTSLGTSSTFISTTRLRPVFGTATGAGAPNLNYFDYCLAYWTTRPLNS